MSETLSFLFAQFSFLLRDVFGYVVPGGIVLISFAYFFRASSLTLYIKNVASSKSVGAWVVGAVICYFVGHAVAGFAFNLWPGNAVYSYYPSAESGEQQDVVSWTTFIKAVDKITSNHARDSMFRAERERHVVINQMSGNGSAACVASLFLGLVSLLYYRKKGDKTAPTSGRGYCAILILLIVGLGLWFEHRRFRVRQYTFEQYVVGLTQSATGAAVLSPQTVETAVRPSRTPLAPQTQTPAPFTLHRRLPPEAPRAVEPSSPGSNP